MRPVRIWIDEGHGYHRPNGYWDCGAKKNGLWESVLTGDLTTIILGNLTGHPFGIECKTTRELFHVAGIVERNEDLNRRARGANEWKADLFLSLHFNSVSKEQPRGGLVRIYGEKTRWIGDIFLSMLPKSRWSRVWLSPGLRVLRKTRMPAVLLEPLFLSNPADANYIKKEGLDFLGWNISIAIRQVADRMSQNIASNPPGAGDVI